MSFAAKSKTLRLFKWPTPELVVISQLYEDRQVFIKIDCCFWAFCWMLGCQSLEMPYSEREVKGDDLRREQQVIQSPPDWSKWPYQNQHHKVSYNHLHRLNLDRTYPAKYINKNVQNFLFWETMRQHEHQKQSGLATRHVLFLATSGDRSVPRHQKQIQK